MNKSTASELELLVKVEGIDEPTIATYFVRLNSSDYKGTAALFASRGRLAPPFENPIEGRSGIAAYLETEASGMSFWPESGVLLIRDDNLAQYHIQGKVKTNYFTINVSWLIQLSIAKEIMLVEVKLLAPLEELLKFTK